MDQGRHTSDLNGNIGSPAITGVPAIGVHNLLKRFGTQSVLREISFNIMAGELFVVLGASGSGKTTLLRIIG